MSRHLTIATGATALFALAGRGVAFSIHEGGIVVGPTPTSTPTPTPAAPATTAAAPKFTFLHAHIKAATEPTIAGPANFIKNKANAKDDEDKGGEDEDEDEKEKEDEVEEAETGACKVANQLISHCASAIPNIESAPEDEIAQCLCCDGDDGSFEPDYFDGAAASCAGWMETAVPESTGAYSAWSTLATLCGHGGMDSNVCSWSNKTPAPATATATATAKGVVAASVSASASASASSKTSTITSAPAATAVSEACASLTVISSYCLEETSRFDDLPLSSQAECLCYMSPVVQGTTRTTSWIPDYFDDAYSLCAGSVSTMSLDPGFVNLCSRYGDFLVQSVSATTTAEGSSGSAAAGSGSSASETASSSATAVTATVAPSGEPDSTGAAAAGLSLPASWPVAIGAMLGAAILLL